MFLEKELYKRVDEVVHYLWDPIGISGTPGARDEYDAYLADIMLLLVKNDPQELADYLNWAVTEHMQFPSQKEKDANVVETLFRWKNTLSQKDSSGGK